MSRLVNSQFSFADWELLRQGVVLEPSLAAIADFLDEHEEIVEAIRGDLRCGLKRPDTGRKGLTAQQVLRSLILMRVKNWDYRELRERTADGLTLRQFADFNAQPVPKHDAFQRAFTRLTPQTVKLINELLVQAAVAMGLRDGSKLRVDTTVVATDIHHPTDNTLLWDVVRVVTRLVGRLADTIERPIKGFRNRTRAARRRMLAIQRMTTTQRQTQQRGKYRELIGIAEEVVERARRGLRHTRNVRAKDVPSQLALDELRRQIEHYCGLGERVIDQSRRRVLQEEQVPNPASRPIPSPDEGIRVDRSGRPQRASVGCLEGAAARHRVRMTFHLPLQLFPGHHRKLLWMATWRDLIDRLGIRRHQDVVPLARKLNR